MLLLIQGLLKHYAKNVQTDIELPLALVMAYIGKAAFNVKGTTIYSALHLPLVTREQTSLSSKKLDTLSAMYKNLQLIVLDEVSLIGFRTFQLIDTRLRSIKHIHDKPFGRVDVIMCGDLFQASPIRDSWIFKQQDHLKKFLAPPYWRSHCRCLELQTTMRQRNNQLINVLNRV